MLLTHVVRPEQHAVVRTTRCPPNFNPIEDVFPMGSSWLRRFSLPDEYSAWSMFTINSMLEHITGEKCHGFLRAAMRRCGMYVQ